MQNGLGAKSQILSSVACTPRKKKLGCYFQSGTCLGVLDTHVLQKFLWSIVCKWPVINVTLLTLKNSSTQNKRLIGYFTKVSMKGPRTVLMNDCS